MLKMQHENGNAKLHRTDLIICTHSREGKPLSCSRINMVGM